MKINSIKTLGTLTQHCKKLLFNEEGQIEKLEKLARKYKKKVVIAQKSEDLLLINSGYKTSAIRISELNEMNSIYSKIVANLYENSVKK